MIRQAFLPLAVLSFAAASLAGEVPATLVVEGRLTSDGVGVDDIVDIDITARDGASTVIGEWSETGVVLVDGTFAIAVDVGAMTAALETDSVVFEVRADEVGATAIIGSVAAARRAARASSAPVADEADTLGTQRPAELVSASALAAPGGPRILYDNINIGRPAGIDDGDDGDVLATGAGLSITSGALTLGPITGALITDGTVDSDAIADGTVTTTQVTVFGNADVADASLTGADFAPVSFTSSDVAGLRQALFQLPRGCDTLQGFATTTTCTKRTGCVAGEARDCASGLCETGNVTFCSTTRLGELLFKR